MFNIVYGESAAKFRRIFENLLCDSGFGCSTELMRFAGCRTLCKTSKRQFTRWKSSWRRAATRRARPTRKLARREWGCASTDPRGAPCFCGDTMDSPLQVLQPGVSTSSFLDPASLRRPGKPCSRKAASTGRLIRRQGHFRGARRAHVHATGGSFPRFFLSSRHRCSSLRGWSNAYSHPGMTIGRPRYQISFLELRDRVAFVGLH